MVKGMHVCVCIEAGSYLSTSLLTKDEANTPAVSSEQQLVCLWATSTTSTHPLLDARCSYPCRCSVLCLSVCLLVTWYLSVCLSVTWYDMCSSMVECISLGGAWLLVCKVPMYKLHGVVAVQKCHS